MHAPPLWSASRRACIVLGVAAAMVPSAGRSATLTIELPDVAHARRIAADYVCGGTRFSATYIEAGDTALAVLPVEGKTRVFALAPSGSGARYVSGFYVWWSKGRAGMLYDVRRSEETAILTCAQAP